MSCVAYYLQKGHNLDYLLNLSEDAKTMFIASMECMAEKENERVESIFKLIAGG